MKMTNNQQKNFLKELANLGLQGNILATHYNKYSRIYTCFFVCDDLSKKIVYAKKPLDNRKPLTDVWFENTDTSINDFCGF